MASNVNNVSNSQVAATIAEALKANLKKITKGDGDGDSDDRSVAASVANAAQPQSATVGNKVNVTA